MVRALLGLTVTPAADAADAFAIGLTHLRAQEVRAAGDSIWYSDMNDDELQVRWLGRVEFGEAIALQE